MKIIINRGFKPFKLSYEALIELRKVKHKLVTKEAKKPYIPMFHADEVRLDKDVIEVVERLGTKAASAPGCALKVIEIPDDVKYYIDDQHNSETVHENHRVWQ